MFDFDKAREQALDRLAVVVEEINEMRATSADSIPPELMPMFCLHFHHLQIWLDVTRDHLDALEELHDYDVKDL